MSVLSDQWIKKMALEKDMIKPFVPEQKRDNVISPFVVIIFAYIPSSNLVPAQDINKKLNITVIKRAIFFIFLYLIVQHSILM